MTEVRRGIAAIWKRSAGSRLYWRIYLHGIGLLLLTAFAVIFIGHLPRHESHGRFRRTMFTIGDDIDRVIAEGGDLHAELGSALDDYLIDVTVYSAGDQLLSTNIEPPLTLVSADTRSDVIHHGGFEPPRGGPQGVGVMLLPDSGATVMWRPAWHNVDDRFQRVIITVLVMLAILTILSLPLARRIANPIDKLVDAAHRLGSGDLTSRTGITRRDDIGDLARAFDEMADRIEKLLRGEKELLANISHELRTPLARMKVALELGAEGDAEAARRYLAEVGTDISELEHLIDDVLTTARFDLASSQPRSVPPLHLTSIASAAIAHDAAARFKSAHPDRTLTMTAAADTVPLVADRVLLRRAVDNLLENAAKYSDPGAPVELQLSHTSDHAVFCVRDHGAGMPEADLKQLFTPFFRGDKSRSRATGGFGLGLALARRIVEAHGGTLTADSALGVGSTFVVRVPIELS